MRRGDAPLKAARRVPQRIGEEDERAGLQLRRYVVHQRRLSAFRIFYFCDAADWEAEGGGARVVFTRPYGSEDTPQR